MARGASSYSIFVTMKSVVGLGSQDCLSVLGSNATSYRTLVSLHKCPGDISGIDVFFKV